MLEFGWCDLWMLGDSFCLDLLRKVTPLAAGLYRLDKALLFGEMDRLLR